MASRFTRILIGTISVLILLAALGGGWFYLHLRASLPQLDGVATLPGLEARTTVTRDALGVVTLRGTSRLDVARALGYAHAQDRFFQMDLLRRSAAGELAELVGPAALPLDRNRRIHQFRRQAREVWERLPPTQKAVVEAYTTGVNAGRTALDAAPFEYFLLRTTPVPWLPEDSLLVAFAITFDLQGSDGRYEHSLDTVREVFGDTGLAFFSPLIGPTDAALDNSTAPLPPLPSERLIDVRQLTGDNLPTVSTVALPEAGSNVIALAGDRTASGAALLADDMHLALGVPGTWYRTSLQWGGAPDGPPTHNVTGVTLPGTPALLAGSNGHIAWGFTNAYADTSDLVVVDANNTAPETFYSVGTDMERFDVRKETLLVKGSSSVEIEARWTRWGPIVATAANGHPLALKWTAHDPNATDFTVMELETAGTIDDAIAIAHRAGTPALNLMVADRSGSIAWTVSGRLPRRDRHSGRLPVTWAFGDRGWNGLLAPEEIPTVIVRPAEESPLNGQLWNGNARPLGGEALTLLGDGGYFHPARSAQLRDDLTAIKHPATPADLLAIQLDDHARFYKRWRALLLQTLDDPTAPPSTKTHHALRAAVAAGTDRASVDDPAHGLVRAFRHAVAERVLTPIFLPCVAVDPDFNYRQLPYEEPLWRILTERPPHFLSGRFATWPELLRSAVDDTIVTLDRKGFAPENATWGRLNRAALRHPLSRALPGFISDLLGLDMPADPLPGDEHIPRVQRPTFGASQRFVVSPGLETEGFYHQPAGQSGHPLSPFYAAGHDAWVKGEPTPFLPGPTLHTLALEAKSP